MNAKRDANHTLEFTRLDSLTFTTNSRSLDSLHGVKEQGQGMRFRRWIVAAIATKKIQCEHIETATARDAPLKLHDSEPASEFFRGDARLGDAIAKLSYCFLSRFSGWHAALLRRTTQIQSRLPALTLLLLLSVTPASAACLNWSWLASNPSYRLVYEGTLGDHPIRMMLHLDSSTGRFDGAYGYSDQPEMLSLIGSMQPKSAGTDLDERDEKDQVTGHFTLSFFHPHPAWESQENYEKENKDTCSFLTGSWQSSSGNKSFKVVLEEVGDTVLENDSEREMNEGAAYKLRKAMLENDRNTFASLLQYPFHSESDRQKISVWKSPEDVIKNYDNIVPFSHKQIRASVPHALQTSATGSQFMNRSIYLAHGKVTRICAEACPVIPQRVLTLDES